MQGLENRAGTWYWDISTSVSTPSHSANKSKTGKPPIRVQPSPTRKSSLKSRPNGPSLSFPVLEEQKHTIHIPPSSRPQLTTADAHSISTRSANNISILETQILSLSQEVKSLKAENPTFYSGNGSMAQATDDRDAMRLRSEQMALTAAVEMLKREQVQVRKDITLLKKKASLLAGEESVFSQSSIGDAQLVGEWTPPSHHHPLAHLLQPLSSDEHPSLDDAMDVDCLPLLPPTSPPPTSAPSISGWRGTGPLKSQRKFQRLSTERPGSGQ